MMDERFKDCIDGFEDGGSDHEPRNAALGAGKDRETESPLKTPRSLWSCQHPAFSQ